MAKLTLSQLIRHAAAQPDLHQQVLEKAIPDWLPGASTTHREALRTTPPKVLEWHQHAPHAQRLELKAAVAESWAAQNQLDGTLATLKSPTDFAKPLLQDALKRQFGLEHDVSAIHLRLYLPLKTPWLPILTGGFRVSTTPLIEAALHNFEAAEQEPDAYAVESTFTSPPTATGQFDILRDVSNRLTVAGFIGLCRTLDIGAQYQRYLKQALGFETPSRLAQLRNLVKTHLGAEARAALHMARMKKDIDTPAFYPLQGQLEGLQGMMLDGRPLLSHDLRLMSAPLTGITLFAPDLELNRSAVPVVAYIPGDPESPLKYYPSSTAFMQALTAKLRSADYQKFFSRFVNHDDRGHFFADLNSRLSHITWHQHVPGQAQPTWRETPATTVNLQFSVTKIGADLYEHLYRQKLDKILNDAAVTAISTADADRKARWERWDIVQSIAKTILEVVAFIAAPFIPPLGALMLGYTAYQLLDETFEGIIDWAVGLKNQAFGHLMAVIEQAVQLGLFAVGMPLAEGLLREKLPKEIWSFFDRLHPVKNAADETRLWNPDLSPYTHDIRLPDDSRPDNLGLHRHNSDKILKVGTQHFAIEQNNGRSSLLHPTRQNAYRPRVMSNGKGAWVTELDRPLSWSSETLLRRIDPTGESLSDERLAQVRQISGTHDGALRKMYMNRESPPPLLADTLSRVSIDQELQDFIDQMNSDDPQQYRQANTQTQLWLITNKGLWPKAKTLRFLNEKGQAIWEFPGQEQAAIAQIHEAQLINGDLLSTLLETLNEPQRKVLLEEEFGYPTTSLETRTKKLRKRLARLAQEHRGSLFDTYYRKWALQQTSNPRTQKIIDATSGLTTTAAQEVLSASNAEELLEIDQGRIPPRVSELARWAAHQVRVTRAYEGLYLDSLDSSDTHRLALHSLEKLPGWSSHVHLAVTDYSRTGTIRDSIGNRQAPIQRILVRTIDGEYVPEDEKGTVFGATDFYTAILQALPDAQRNALDIHIGQGPLLRQTLRQHALDRDALGALLASSPIRKPAYNPDLMRLPGGMDGYGATPSTSSAGPSLTDRLRDLFPTLEPHQATDVLSSLERQPGGALPTLISMKREYFRLEQDLSAWIANTPRVLQGTHLPLSEAIIAGEEQNRRLWATEIKRCWRHETETDEHFHNPDDNGNVLRLTEPVYGDLPALGCRFGHVSRLDLRGYPTTQKTTEFLGHFPNLRRLEIRDITLSQVPTEITSRARINDLRLNNCAITLTAQGRASLAAMNNLKTLDLANNPLALAPTVENMPRLQTLNLTNTQITQVPDGLSNRPQLSKANLSDNQITELPETLFALPGETTEDFDLSGNPLSRATLERIKTYCQQTGEHMGADANLAERHLVHELFPTYTGQEAGRFIFELPGSLDDSLAILTRLKADYQHLQADLEEWVLDVPEQHPVTGAPLDDQVRARHQIIRRAFKEQLEECWRRESALDESHTPPAKTHEFESGLAILGALPELNVDFNHVSCLQLVGEGSTSIPEGFLNRFPELESLLIHRYALGEIPGAVFNLSKLKLLTLTRNNLHLTPATADALSGLHGLDFLDLSHNALGISPNVSMMSNLNTLMLEDTGLTQVPEGAFNLPILMHLDLSDNLITELPSDILEVPPQAAENFELNGNPLSQDTVAMLRTYYERTGEHFGVIEASLDVDMNPIQTLQASSTDDEMEM